MNRELIEEARAGSAILVELARKPINDTSGDYEHVLSPVAVKIHPPTPSGNGAELAFTITQTDRHHPELVAKTIMERLSGMEELKGYSFKQPDPKEDFKNENTEITIRYDLPAGKADSIIHALSERGKTKGNVGAALASIDSEPPTTWTDRMKSKVFSYLGM